MKNNPHFKKMILALFMITLVMGLAHYFIFLSVTRSLDDNDLFKKIFSTLLTIGLISIPLGFILTMIPSKKNTQWISWIAFIWMGFFHLLFFSSLVEFALTYFLLHSYSYWNLYFSIIIGIWALRNGLQAPQIVTHEIKANPLIAGMSLVQISDLHVGMLNLNGDWLKKIITTVNTLKPDFFAITGDLVEGLYSEVSPQLEVLKEASAKIEKFYITGNHEYIHGSGPWEERLQELGYTILHNQNKVVKFNQAKILFAGVPDRMVTRFDSRFRSRPDLALQSTEKVDYKILLAHEPASIWDLKTESCDLVVTGHTHGGQIFPFGILVRLVQPVVTGFKKIKNTLVFAHQGTGFWGPPMRWFSRSEIVIFKFIC